MGSTTGPRVPTSVDDFRALASTRLGRFPHTEVPDAPGLRRAAVLLCVVDQPGSPLSVIVIRRAYRGRNAGQWGLPGGRVDPGETAEQAAIRELHEELGLTATPADLLGRLDDFPATSGFAITPIVAALADVTDLRPSPAEVHSVHHVDLARLAADDVPHWVPRSAAVRQVDIRDDEAPAVPADGPGLLQMRLAEGMTIHAPTGAMLWQFREVVLLGRDPAEARIAHFAQPDWTRH
ncbi:CoA pyrophosphatase [Nocardia sp. NBC_00565]|uniref:NUDIX hydrolase n=1 Tax=Nocardia sp. NBC_00565 TaxID=2975993 RepID=UPI002E80E056|nr:CoA pyrophosphatase [Nocardia sp. NBC_00565]WUC01494.1 CoA pyrophosphatase [Nocardia sp. NBC_00565]